MARKKASKYDGYTDYTKEFMTAVEAFVKKKYGKIGPQGAGQHLYHRYKICSKENL